MLSAHSCWVMQWLKYATAPECQDVLEDTAAILGPGHHGAVVSAQRGASWACAHVCTICEAVSSLCSVCWRLAVAVAAKSGCEAVSSQPHSLTSQQPQHQGANTHCKVRTAMLLASSKAAFHAKQLRV